MLGTVADLVLAVVYGGAVVESACAQRCVRLQSLIDLRAVMTQQTMSPAASQKNSAKKASVIDILAIPKIRLDSVERMTHIQNTS